MKSTLKNLGVLAGFYVVLFILMTISEHCNILLIPYDAENYRYVLSALIQSVAGLAALMISSTLIAIQLMHNQSQRSMDLFPTNIFIGFFVSIIITIIWDTVALFNLKKAVAFNTQVNLTYAIYMNIIPFLITLIYFFEVKRVTTVKYMGDKLAISAVSCKSFEDATNLILTLEEMIFTAIKSSSVDSIGHLQDNFVKVTKILSNKYKTDQTQEDIFFSREYPFRKIPEVLERVVSKMLESDSEKMIPKWGEVIEILTNQSIYSDKAYARELARTTASIIKKILNKDRVEIANALISRVINVFTDTFGDSVKLTIISAVSDQLVVYPNISTAKEVFAEMVFTIWFCLYGDAIQMNQEFSKTIEYILAQYKLRFEVEDSSDDTVKTLYEMLANR